MTCEVCGKEFLRRKSRGSGGKPADANRCCSRECGFVLVRQQVRQLNARRLGSGVGTWIHWYFRSCKVCGETFVTKSKALGISCCGAECKKEWARARARTVNMSKSKKGLAPKACPECGEIFTPSYGDRRRTFCSIRCSRRPMKRARNAKIRAARPQGILSANVRFNDLWIRSGGICHICGELCLRDHEIKELRPTLDHVVPLASGGSHAMDNVDIAHSVCNTFKGERPITDLLRSRCRNAVKAIKEGLDPWRFHPLKADVEPMRGYQTAMQVGLLTVGELGGLQDAR